ncbi:MAG: TonB-dependent siderophore receptor [Rubrivivax sp.]|nr:TonB-dependent siderophore receptor [Rubrivivax sp.]
MTDQPADDKPRSLPLIPLGALAAGFGLINLAAAQTSPPAPATTDPPRAETVMPVIKASGSADRQGKDGVQATTSRIGKGEQELRDIPQSLTVVTEKLIDDRNLDTLKEALKNTAGITFQAAEGGEEDIRLRGFPLQGTGDVFVDGIRDPAFYDRDTFSYDRLEVLRGSASMLFGRGSTGGAVNQVSKVPRAIDEHQVDLTLGSHQYARLVGDFNFRLGDEAALRLGAMVNKADNNGAGSSIDKKGVAATLRWGIGTRDEFSIAGYFLDNDNGMNYGMPWIRPKASSPVDETTLLPVDPKAYYGMASDRNDGKASTLTATHTHRFDRNHELTTKIRRGAFERDQRAGTVRFAGASAQPDGQTVSLETLNPASVINRGTQLKIQDLDAWFAQSDYSGKFSALGVRHQVQAGIDYAREEKTVYAARSAAQGGVVPPKPTTTLGTPDDGAWIDESVRVLRTNNDYTSNGGGVYVQDLIQLAPALKLLVGLRYDSLTGNYNTYALPNNAPSPETRSSYRMKVSEWSKRLGLLYQPTPLTSFHFSAATSFNTSGDAYSLSAANVDIPPEQAINLELGAKLDSEDGKLSARIAAFRSTKLHERNTDPLVNLVTLSGKRHVAGIDMDIAGRITPAWEVYFSYMWLPVANIDIGAAGSEGQGTRPSLTPRHAGTVWSTYQVDPRLRVGAGLNMRASQTPNRNPGWSAPGYVTGDLMAEYVVMHDRLTLKLNLSNVTNKLYADSLYTGHYIPGLGRLLQLTASWKY